MDIEQTRPNKPRFGLIVALSCFAVLVVFGIALIFLKVKHIDFRHTAPNPNAGLHLAPASPPELA